MPVRQARLHPAVAVVRARQAVIRQPRNRLWSGRCRQMRRGDLARTGMEG